MIIAGEHDFRMTPSEPEQSGTRSCNNSMKKPSASNRSKLSMTKSYTNDSSSLKFSRRKSPELDTSRGSCTWNRSDYSGKQRRMPDS